MSSTLLPDPALIARIAEIASWSLIVAGAVLSIIGGIGMLRLPDLYTRVHAASVGDTGGMLLILLGLMIQAGLSGVTLKLVLIVIFLLITSPTATHALTRAARHEGFEPDTNGQKSSVDEDTRRS